jgi:DNA-binding transcriptional regulator YdaS (Cro superfamily)
MNTNDSPQGIELALSKVGSQEKLAQLMGVSQQAISAWLRRGYVPVQRAAEIEFFTGVHRHSLIKPRLRDLLDLEDKRSISQVSE